MAARYESIDVEDSAIGISDSLIDAKAKKATMILETASIRYRIDGTDPTTTEGKPVQPGQEIILDTYDDIYRFKAIRTGATTGVLKVNVF